MRPKDDNTSFPSIMKSETDLNINDRDSSIMERSVSEAKYDPIRSSGNTAVQYRSLLTDRSLGSH